MQPWISLVTTVAGDLLVLAAAIINLAAATRARPRGRGRRRHRQPPAARPPGNPAIR